MAFKKKFNPKSNNFYKNLKPEVHVYAKSTHSPTEEQQAIIDAAKAGKNLAIHAFAGAAKAQPSYCMIQTPSGGIPMGDIRVGDALFRRDGSIGQVIGKFPQGIRDTYKVIFRDGSITYCNEEHLWAVEVIGSNKNVNGPKYETKVFGDILDYGVRRPSGAYRWKIPLCSPVEYPSKHFDVIHPYILGLLLGDGSIAEGKPLLSVGRNEWDILTELTDFLPIGYTFSERLTSDNCKQLYLKPEDSSVHKDSNMIIVELAKLGVCGYSHEKRIPTNYLRGDISERYWLLRGLMDSDGNCSSNRTRFSSTSRSLIDDVQELVQSLGGTTILGETQHTNRENPLYELNVKTFDNPFYNKSKASKWTFSYKNPPSRYIIDIEKVSESEQYCIKVDAPDSLYLTDSFIVTHNTSTCVMVSEELVTPSLYIAFNKSIAEEASGRFPTHVEPRTVHSMAYRAIVTTPMKARLQGFFDFRDIDYPELVDVSPLDITVTKANIAKIITLFCQSGARNIVDFVKELEFDKVEQAVAVKFWVDIVDPRSTKKITHDVYLKLYQLSKPKLPYKVIYLDEAQDSSPVILDIVLRQTAQVVIVGDEFQAIYEWRGAINAFDTIAELGNGYTDMYLTESFRFTQDIANTAEDLLSITGNTKSITGKADIANRKVGKTTKAFLVRTNASILAMLIDAADKGEKVHVLADLKDLWSKVYHINSLTFGEKPKYPDMQLSQYPTIKEFNEAAKVIPELGRLKNVVSTLSTGGLHSNIAKIKSAMVDDESKANYTIATGHKSKGLEFDEVTLHNDVLNILDPDSALDLLMDNQTLNLLYVMVTRAKYKLNLPDSVKYVLLERDRLRHEYRERL